MTLYYYFNHIWFRFIFLSVLNLCNWSFRIAERKKICAEKNLFVKKKKKRNILFGGKKRNIYQLACKGSHLSLQARSFLMLSSGTLEKVSLYIEKEEPEIIFQHIVSFSFSVCTLFGLSWSSCYWFVIIVLVTDESAGHLGELSIHARSVGKRSWSDSWHGAAGDV